MECVLRSIQKKMHSHNQIARQLLKRHIGDVAETNFSIVKMAAGDNT